MLNATVLPASTKDKTIKWASDNPSSRMWTWSKLVSSPQTVSARR
jgi:uncharacterized protein YjdB